jgi:hypothetical protein
LKLTICHAKFRGIDEQDMFHALLHTHTQKPLKKKKIPAKEIFFNENA